jgi:hypothetical protein
MTVLSGTAVTRRAPPRMAYSLHLTTLSGTGPDEENRMSDGRSDLVDQLAKLASLRDSGALSQTEFETAKARVLGTSPTQPVQPGPGAAQHAEPTTPSPEGQLPPKDLVRTCTDCGKVLGAVRLICSSCSKNRGSAETRPWREQDGWVSGVPKSLYLLDELVGLRLFRSTYGVLATEVQIAGTAWP